MNFIDLVNSRTSIRNFNQKEINEDTITNILELTRRAPSAGNLQAYDLYLVRDDKVKDLIAKASFNQDFIRSAPVILIFCAHPDRSKIRYGSRGQDLYSVQDATIACTFAMLSVVNYGLGCVWVGAFNEKVVRNILGITNNLKPVAILPIGYPNEKSEPSTRRALEEFIHRID